MSRHPGTPPPGRSRRRIAAGGLITGAVWVTGVALMGALWPRPAMAAAHPGRVGAYVSIRDAELQSPSRLRQLMQELKDSGVDFILPPAKQTSGVVNWDSAVAPAELRGAPTAMGQVLRAAHAVGLKVYPVVCVATEGGESGPNALLQKNPTWAFHYDGRRQGYVDPGNADARRYEIALITELITKYDVDGLSLDYMRCPNRIGYTDTGREHFLRHHQVDLASLAGPDASAELDTEGGKQALNQRNAAARAHPVWPEWKRWRTEQMNQFMRELAGAVRQAKPGLPISSYVWGAHTYSGNFETCQDWKTWIARGWLDWINPSGYRYTDAEFREALRANRQLIPRGFPCYITIGVATSHGKLESAAAVNRYLRMAAEGEADGIILFRWHSVQPFLPEVAPHLRAWPKTP